jgi:hypothetical protein
VVLHFVRARSRLEERKFDVVGQIVFDAESEGLFSGFKGFFDRIIILPWTAVRLRRIGRRGYMNFASN